MRQTTTDTVNKIRFILDHCMHRERNLKASGYATRIPWMRWLILVSYYFFFWNLQRVVNKVVLTFTTCFEYLQRV